MISNNAPVFIEYPYDNIKDMKQNQVQEFFDVTNDRDRQEYLDKFDKIVKQSADQYKPDSKLSPATPEALQEDYIAEKKAKLIQLLTMQYPEYEKDLLDELILYPIEYLFDFKSFMCRNLFLAIEGVFRDKIQDQLLLEDEKEPKTKNKKKKKHKAKVDSEQKTSSAEKIPEPPKKEEEKK